MDNINLSVYQACAGQHFGLWSIEPHWFCQAVVAIKSGVFEPKAQLGAPEGDREKGYVADANGIAHIGIIGQMAKGVSSFGGASTVLIRQAVRSAVENKAVEAIMLHIDSPGGTVAGTAALANDVASANAKKPVYAHIEDQCASAAYWIASQAGHITAEPTSLVGSIGTVAYVVDTSGEFEKNGWKAHVISTGKFKGAFADGTEINEDQLAYVQNLVNETNEHFLAAIASGRGMSVADVRRVADGRMWDAEKAKAMGLIDDVLTIDQVAGIATSDIQARRARNVKVNGLKARSILRNIS